MTSSESRPNPPAPSGDLRAPVKVCLKCRKAFRSNGDKCPRDGTPFATSDLASGTVLADKYRIIDEIGRGGMGVVYRAEHIIMGKTVALKVVHPLLSINPTFLEMFKSEARHAATFKHEHVLTVHDFGEADGRFYLVAELLEGENLKSLLHHEGSLIPERAFKILLQICDAVAAAHRAGILHLDLKTENVFMLASENDQIKVLDFGLAQPKGDATIELENGMTIGTVGYMAPEQIMAGHVDERTDIYAIGVIAYEMLTGEVPFPGQTKEDVLQAQLRGETTKFPSNPVLKIIPREAKKAIAACYSANPERRPQTVEELAEKLQHARNEIERAAKRYTRRKLRGGRGEERGASLLARAASAVAGMVRRRAGGPAAPGGMVYVPAGEFVMGSNGGASDERPALSMPLEAYFIDITPVTNLEYARFVQATDHRPPSTWKTLSLPSGTGDLPVIGVTWQDAVDYATWAGKRLPTEAEWEKAARGTDARTFPWGNKWDPTYANWGGNPRYLGGASLKPVGSFPNDRSPYGCLDIAGNVKEWTSSWYKPYGPSDFRSDDFGEKFIVVRGGSYLSQDRSYLRVSNRSHVRPEEAGDIGFRCVKSIEK
jgi:serine/threonine-protein kinase